MDVWLIAAGAATLLLGLLGGSLLGGRTARSREQAVAVRLDEIQQRSRAQEAELILGRETAKAAAALGARLEAQESQAEALTEELRGRIRELQGEREQMAVERAQAESARAASQAELGEARARLSEQERQAQELKAFVESARQQVQDAFRAAAAQELANARSQLEQADRQQLAGLLEPFREQVAAFQAQVSQTQQIAAERHGDLKNQLARLVEAESRLSSEASNLTRALKGEAATRGAWGELILEKVLAYSGLREGHEYRRQMTVVGEEGERGRLDVVLDLPTRDDAGQPLQVVIDSKVSLVAYDAWTGAGNDAERAVHLKAHLTAVHARIEELASKDYRSLVGAKSIDFVLLFMPIEGAFSLAVQADDGLYQYALNKHVLIVSPTTLLAVLRTVASLWSLHRMNVNAENIAVAGGKLYDKLRAFIETMDALGDALGKARGEWEKARGQLALGKGNAIALAERLRGMGARVKKQLPGALIAEAGADEDSDEPPGLDEGEEAGEAT